MMPDREKYIEVLSKTAKTVKESYEHAPIKISLECIEDILELLKEQEAVVRCKDCRYWLPMDRFHQDYHPGNGECELNCWVRQMDWFCADGERREYVK